MKTNENLISLSNAMFSNALPCNPIPFLNGLIEGVKLNGTDYIQSDEAKKILQTILNQSYGQLFNIDSYNEYLRLKG